MRGTLASLPWQHSSRGRTRSRSSGSRCGARTARRRGDPRPADGLPVAGLVVHPDIMGIRPLFDDLCRRLATHGLAVCAPEPFAARSTGATTSTRRRAWTKVLDLDDETQLGDLERAADWLVVDDDVSEVSVLGFCMGGMYALKAAATGRFDRAVAFYGMIRVPEGWRGPASARAARDRGRRVPDARDLRERRHLHAGRRHRRAARRVGAAARLRGRRLRRRGARLRPRRRAPRAPRRRRRRRAGRARCASSASTERPRRRIRLRVGAELERLAVEDVVAAAAGDLDPAEPGEHRQRLVDPLA